MQGAQWAASRSRRCARRAATPHAGKSCTYVMDRLATSASNMCCNSLMRPLQQYLRTCLEGLRARGVGCGEVGCGIRRVPADMPKAQCWERHHTTPTPTAMRVRGDESSPQSARILPLPTPGLARRRPSPSPHLRKAPAARKVVKGRTRVCAQSWTAQWRHARWRQFRRAPRNAPLHRRLVPTLPRRAHAPAGVDASHQ